MTIADTNNTIQYDGNGATDTFSTGTIIFYDATDLIVIQTDTSTNISTTLTLTTGYTVTGGNGSAGSVTLVAGNLATGQRLTIVRSIPYVQSDDYVEGENILAETIETAFDKSVIRDQQLRDSVNKSLKFSDTLSSSLVGNITETPVSGALLGWSGVGGDVVNILTADLGNSVDTLLTSLANNDFLKYNSSNLKWENINLYTANQSWTGTNKYNDLTAVGSAGLALKNSNGDTVINIGAGGGINTTVEENILITGSASSAGHIILREDTDNGTNGVSIYAPASVASDRTITLPDADGTVATQEYVASEVDYVTFDDIVLPGTATFYTYEVPSGYKSLDIEFIGFDAASASEELFITFSDDNVTFSSSYQYNLAFLGSAYSGVNVTAGASIEVIRNILETDAYTAMFRFAGLESGEFGTVHSVVQYQTSTQLFQHLTTGKVNDTDAVNYIKFASGSGNISGTIRARGIK